MYRQLTPEFGSTFFAECIKYFMTHYLMTAWFYCIEIIPPLCSTEHTESIEERIISYWNSNLYDFSNTWKSSPTNMKLLSISHTCFLSLSLFAGAIPAPPENHELFGPMFLLPSKVAVERQHFPEAVTVGWEKKQKEEDSSVLSTLPAAETEKVESDLCYGIQKPMHEKKDIKKVSKLAEMVPGLERE